MFTAPTLGACDAKTPTGTPVAASDGAGTTSDGRGRALPDGTHDGYLSAVNVAGRTVTVDKVELLGGEAARKAYQKQNPGATDGPDNSTLFKLTIKDGKVTAMESIYLP